MELRQLIDDVKAGDVYAFTELARRYQDLAFGYAYAILGDFHLAQDAAQEAFVVTYFDVGKLKDPDAFPGWLRTVVRYQCGRLLRKRIFELVPLDHASEVRSTAISPEEHAEKQAMLEEVIQAINALPRAQREVVTLYYIKEFSQQEVAAFLDLPPTVVNNRLHAARKQLKRRILTMTKDAFREHALPEDFARRLGRIVEVRGPVVDARFEPDRLPALLTALTIADPQGDVELSIEVAQHLGNGLVRCIATSSTAGLAHGMEAVSTGKLASQGASREALRQAVDALGGSVGHHPGVGSLEVLETGIKVIDLLCPYRKGGKAAVLGEMGVGKAVVIEEVVHNVASRADGVSLFTFVRPGNEAALFEQAFAEGPLAGAGAVQTVFLAADDPRDPFPTADVFDAVTHMTRDLVARQLYPAVDPLRSTSRLLEAAIVGTEHFEVAQRVRETLGRAKELQSADAADLPGEDRVLLERAAKIEHFLTQPFFVAEPYTNRPGQYVSREETVRALGALLAGAYDDLPQEAFLWCGTIEQVVEQARSRRS